eukprot:TRINITY_DN27298_c0_g1_i1.p1 TRINITY_DN27298_c0_g1~~TRINITY_DN27298_c0_g1_i1.p1  ORF type:complete len:324 (+),score=102.44 TRINITY_DN27298_c0_g1_i1:85-1056(+)
MPQGPGQGAADDALTMEEQTRYDRQVRLWGVDAQLRMMRSRVLVITVHGLGTEVTKNLVLGGVGEVVICDGAVLTEEDMGSCFLAGARVGQTRAEAALAEFRAMNGLVKLSAVAAAPSAVPVQGYDVVIATDLGRDEALALNTRCREHGVPFISCCAFGLLALSFSDFGPEFSASVEDPSTKGARRKLAVPFRSLEETCGSPPQSWAGAGVKPSFIVAACLWEAGLHVGAGLAPEGEARQRLAAAADALCTRHDLSRAAVLPEVWLAKAAAHGVGAYAPTCAIAGGIVAQEALKAVQQNAKPIVGFFVLDGLEHSCGYEQRLP